MTAYHAEIAADAPLACAPQAGVARDRAIPDAMALGATLYMPIIHPAIAEIIAGARLPALRSVVLCLEDALHLTDVERGLQRLRALLAGLHANRDATNDATRRHRGGVAARRGHGPLLFVRPRNQDMAHTIAAIPGIDLIDGMVAPKIDLASIEGWWRVAERAGTTLMPTLEQRWVFDPVRLAEFAAALDAMDRRSLFALRIGGNDLLGHLGLRRQRGATIYDGPLFTVLSQAICQLGARGYPLTAPVFDIIDDPQTLLAECRRDAAFGFVAKTAIHPSQIPIIESGFAVAPGELELARAILANDARAVFRHGGAMAEPATHRPWAERVIARATSYGVAHGETLDAAAAQAPSPRLSASA